MMYKITSQWSEERMFAAICRRYQTLSSVCVRNVPAYQKLREHKYYGREEMYWVEKKRYIDALVMSSPKNTRIWAIEIKVTLADLRKEVMDPEKAETWSNHAHAFYVAVPPHLEEEALKLVPKKYGILKVTNAGNKNEKAEVLRRARGNKSPEPLDTRTFFALARRAGRQDFDQCTSTLVIG